MANAIYPKYKEALLSGSANIALTGTVKAALLDTATYTYSATHQYLTDLSGIVGTATAIGSPTVTNGLFDGNDVTFTSVSGATAEAIAIYIDTGSGATSRLVAYIDTGVTGLPVTPNGGNIVVTWNASGIFQL
jgi:predicted membrane protein